MEGLKISIRKYQNLKKCGLCGRVRENYYKLLVSDVNNLEIISGELDLCKECGDNFNKVLGNEFDADEKVEAEFIF